MSLNFEHSAADVAARGLLHTDSTYQPEQRQYSTGTRVSRSDGDGITQYDVNKNILVLSIFSSERGWFTLIT